MHDDGYLAKTGTASYRLTSKGEDALAECELALTAAAIKMTSSRADFKQFCKRHGGKAWTLLVAALAALRSCG